MADKDINSEQIDDDILRCKADILRARDIMPPYKQTDNKQQPSKTGTNPILPTDIKELSIQKDTPKSPIAAQKKSEIPRFDLAEEIMAEQRKLTAIRRKAPGKKTEVADREVQVEPVGYTPEKTMPGQSGQDRLISEIVARDIRILCRGEI